MKRVVPILVAAAVLSGCGKTQPAAKSDPGVSHQAQQSDRLPDGLTPVEKEFLDVVKECFTGGQSAHLVKRIYWEGVPSSLHGLLDDTIVDGVERGYGWIEFERVDPDALTERIEDGQKVKENLPVKWRLTVHHPPEGDGMDVSTVYLLGEDDSKIMFTNSIAE